MLNKVVVAKFGGSSLADAEQFKKVKSIIMSDKRRRFIVPSAPGKRSNKDYKITDLFYMCHAHVKENIPFDDVFGIIYKRYTEIADELGIALDIRPYLEEVRENIASGASSDYTASRGEYLNGLILSSYLGFEFVDPAELIYFDELGHLDQKRTDKSVQQRLNAMENAVIPGFYGSMSDGRIRTFSRGGSDITGSIIARGVGAELYENWTDVSGFLMADPRVVKNPKVIRKITYKELRELSYMGATVLHEEAVFPVRDICIPINIKNTNAPEEPGTLIVSDEINGNPSGTITGIAGRKDFTVISVEKMLMNSEIGFGRKLLSILESYGVSFEHMPSGIDTICLVIADSQLENKLDMIVEDIKQQCRPDCVHVYPNMALIATVGRGMAYTKGMAAKIFTSLAEAGVNIRMIDQGSSEINIIVGVETEDFEKSVRAIYNAFVKSEN